MSPPKHKLRVYFSNDFTGIWPVGTSAIAVASDQNEATALLNEVLIPQNLVFDGTLQELDLTQPQAIVLDNGDY